MILIELLGSHKNIENFLTLLYEGVYLVDKNKLVTYWNPGAETITGHQSSAVSGKQYCKQFLMHVDLQGDILCNTKCPINVSLSEGKICEAELYVHHAEGHRIPVSVRTFPIYDHENQIVGVMQLFRDNALHGFQAKEMADLQSIASIDQLTGLRNRRSAEQKINCAFHDLKAGGPTFGFLFIDIDHFKKINDTYGHNIGDLVLKMIGKTLLNNTRESDIVVRWGGEELVILIMHGEIQNKLYQIANKLRNLIGQSILMLDDGTQIQVTVSIGATIALLSDTVESLVERADKLMYQCKNEGRNCVKVKV